VVIVVDNVDINQQKQQLWYSGIVKTFANVKILLNFSKSYITFLSKGEYLMNKYSIRRKNKAHFFPYHFSIPTSRAYWSEF